jgi:hypothetical protein
MTNCECALAGHCKRHNVSKTKHLIKLCQTDQSFWQSWEDGRGPGQRWAQSDKDARSNRDAVRAKIRTELAEEGRQSWHRLFRCIYTETGLLEWEKTIPKYGCDCEGFYLGWKAKNPVELDQNGYVSFEWKYRLKKAVNEKLGHKNISIEEARQHWNPKWNFVTLADLTQATIELAAKLPPIRGVAGVPVSGLLCSALISTLLHVPHYEASEALGLRQTAHGGRGKTRSVDQSLPLLVVDDTVSSGHAITKVRERLKDEPNVIYSAALANPPAMSAVDLYGRECPEPHLLEWNLANTGYLRLLGYPSHNGGAGVMLDFDGVLCPDPTHYDEETESGREAYLRWISEAPLGTFVPRMIAVPDIVSYRCEYTREASEAWLHKHGIKYERLHLWGDASLPAVEQARSRTWEARDWKGKIYRESKCGLFVESCERQSRDIAGVAKKPVLCWDTRELMQ